MPNILLFAVIMALLTCGLEAQAEDDGDSAKASPVAATMVKDVVGRWKTHGEAIVDIQPCAVETTTSICGVLVWFEELETEPGPVLDKKNNDEALQDRPLQGITLLGGFEEKDKGWRKGWIYDPESGVTYKSKLTRLDESELKVEGCVGPICKKFIWTRIGDSPDDRKSFETAPLETAK